MTFRLDGKRALVTGGGTGIGYAIAQCLASVGAQVWITGRRAEVLQSAANEIGATAIVGDVTTEAARIVAEAGDLDILINNAGNSIKAPADEQTSDDYQKVLDTHVIAGAELARLAARGMRERGNGSIVFVGSMTAHLGVPKVPAYSAAKGAVTALARALAVEWGPDGIRVNTVTPGWITTPMTEKAFASDADRLNKVISRTPLGHLGTPSDIGWAVVYLCSDEAKFVTASEIVVDGGALAGF